MFLVIGGCLVVIPSLDRYSYDDNDDDIHFGMEDIIAALQLVPHHLVESFASCAPFYPV